MDPFRVDGVALRIVVDPASSLKEAPEPESRTQPLSGGVWVVYLAAPHFSFAEMLFNQLLKEELSSHGYRVALPTDFSSQKLSKETMAVRRQELIEKCDAVVCILDGADVCGSVAFEAGVAVSNGKPTLGVRTDTRNIQEGGADLMRSLSPVFMFLDATILYPARPGRSAEKLASIVAERLKELLR
jgi:hypothetical protein